MVLYSTFVCGFVFNVYVWFLTLVCGFLSPSCNFVCFSSCLCCIWTICEFTLHFSCGHAYRRKL